MTFGASKTHAGRSMPRGRVHCIRLPALIRATFPGSAGGHLIGLLGRWNCVREAVKELRGVGNLTIATAQLPLLGTPGGD